MKNGKSAPGFERFALEQRVGDQWFQLGRSGSVEQMIDHALELGLWLRSEVVRSMSEFRGNGHMWRFRGIA